MRSHGSSLRGFPDNILQGWFKMKTTSIFPVHKLASLILISKYAQSRQFFRGFPDNILVFCRLANQNRGHRILMTWVLWP